MYSVNGGDIALKYCTVCLDGMDAKGRDRKDKEGRKVDYGDNISIRVYTKQARRKC